MRRVHLCIFLLFLLAGIALQDDVHGVLSSLRFHLSSCWRRSCRERTSVMNQAPAGSCDPTRRGRTPMISFTPRDPKVRPHESHRLRWGGSTRNFCFRTVHCAGVIGREYTSRTSSLRLHYPLSSPNPSHHGGITVISSLFFCTSRTRLLLTGVVHMCMCMHMSV